MGEWEGSRDHRTQNKGLSWDNKQHRAGSSKGDWIDNKCDLTQATDWQQWSWCHYCYCNSWQWWQHKESKKSTSQQQAISVMTSATTSSEQVSEKQKNKKQRGTQQLQVVCEWVSERDLAAIGLTTKHSPETTNSTELAHPREIGLTTRVIQLKQLASVTLVSLTATATHDNDDNTKNAKNQQVNSKQH